MMGCILLELPVLRLQRRTTSVFSAPTGLCVFLAAAILLPHALGNEGARANADSVLLYVPGSIQEALAQAALVASDTASRDAAKTAREDFKRGQRGHLRDEGGASVADMPTLSAEELADSPIWRDGETYGEVMARLYAAYQEIVVQQVDRYEYFLRAFPHNWYVRHQYALSLIHI